jgi:hypothetical protein
VPACGSSLSPNAPVGASQNPASTGSSTRGKAGPTSQTERLRVAGNAPGCATGEEEGGGVRGEEASRGVEAGPRTGLRRRVCVPVPGGKQGLRASRDDAVQAARIVRPAGGDEQGPGRFRPRDPQFLNAGARRSPVPAS